MNISKTLVNAFEQVQKEKLCSFMFQKVYIDKEVKLEIDAARHGYFFEYLCSGQKERNDDHLPKVKSKKVFDLEKFNDINHVHNEEGLLQEWIFEQIESLYAEEQVLVHQANRFLKWSKMINLNPIAISPVLEYPIKENSIDFIKSIPDMYIKNFHEPENEGDVAYFDFKSTSLINDKWTDFGYGEETEEFAYKRNHINQARTTLSIHYLQTGRIVPFYFYVASYKNKKDVKLFKVLMSEEEIKKSIEQFKLIHEEIMYMNSLNLFFKNAIPDVMNCFECPVAESGLCMKSFDFPKVRTITI